MNHHIYSRTCSDTPIQKHAFPSNIVGYWGATLSKGAVSQSGPSHNFAFLLFSTDDNKTVHVKVELEEIFLSECDILYIPKGTSSVPIEVLSASLGAIVFKVS